jgi:hypothetical protein
VPHGKDDSTRRFCGFVDPGRADGLAVSRAAPFITGLFLVTLSRP